jgi:hypothetical protein
MPQHLTTHNHTERKMEIKGERDSSQGVPTGMNRFMRAD